MTDQSLRRPQERLEVADRAEVGQLVRIDDRTDTRDLAAAYFERYHAHEPLLSVHNDGAWVAVDIGGTYGDARSFGGQAEPGHHRARHAVATVQRPRERRNLASAVTGELNIVGQQCFETRKVTLLGGREEVDAPARRAARSLSRNGVGAPGRGAWPGWLAGARCPRFFRR